MHRYSIVTLAVLGTALFAAPAVSQDFYASHDIQLLISSEPGGGYDSYGRALARHMPRYIEGEPNIIVQNMPGAGGLVATNHLYNIAPQDGTVLAGIQRNVPFMPILGLDGPLFDTYEFNWIGSLNIDTMVLLVRSTADVQEAGDLFDTELIIAGAGPNDTEIPARVMNDLFDTQFNIITGYASGSDAGLAMEQGEVDGVFLSYGAAIQRFSHLIEDGRVNILIQSAPERHSALPDVPLILDFAETEEHRQVLDLMYAQQVVGRPFLAPPNVPAERMEELRAAFDRTVEDPDFIAELERQGLELNPVPGHEIDSMLERLSETPQSVIDRLKAAGFG